jgi:hypothetical protein
VEIATYADPLYQHLIVTRRQRYQMGADRRCSHAVMPDRECTPGGAGIGASGAPSNDGVTAGQLQSFTMSNSGTSLSIVLDRCTPRLAQTKVSDVLSSAISSLLTGKMTGKCK